MTEKKQTLREQVAEVGDRAYRIERHLREKDEAWFDAHMAYTRAATTHSEAMPGELEDVQRYRSWLMSREHALMEAARAALASGANVEQAATRARHVVDEFWTSPE